MKRRTAVVTGAARGIGHAIARRLVREGWNVLLSDIDPAVVEAGRVLGDSAAAVIADVSKPRDAARTAEAAVAAFGGVDALVANAAVGGPDTPLLDTDDDAIRRVFEINFFGVLHSVQAVRPLLAESAEGGSAGRIVVIGSLFAQQPTPGAGAYSASKAAVHSLMRTLSLELAPHCTVNAVAPGYVMTDMHREELDARARRAGRSFEDERDRLAAEVPLGRHGTGADVADAVHHLLSGGDYITGQTLNVNGGVFTS